jgi:hypothetical protein
MSDVGYIHRSRFFCVRKKVGVEITVFVYLPSTKMKVLLLTYQLFLILFVIGVRGNCFLHNPRGSNNRLSEADQEAINLKRHI